MARWRAAPVRAGWHLNRYRRPGQHGDGGALGAEGRTLRPQKGRQGMAHRFRLHADSSGGFTGANEVAVPGAAHEGERADPDNRDGGREDRIRAACLARAGGRCARALGRRGSDKRANPRRGEPAGRCTEGERATRLGRAARGGGAPTPRRDRSHDAGGRTRDAGRATGNDAARRSAARPRDRTAAQTGLPLSGPRSDSDRPRAPRPRGFFSRARTPDLARSSLSPPPVSDRRVASPPGRR